MTNPTPTPSEVEAAWEVINATVAADEQARKQLARETLQPVVDAGLPDLPPLVAALRQVAITPGAVQMDLTSLFLNLSKILDTAIDKVTQLYPGEDEQSEA